MPRLSVISSGLLLTLLQVALCSVAAVPARLSHLASPSTGAAVDAALIESSVKSFKACNLGDAKCTGYQAFGFCCPAGSTLTAGRNGPGLYSGRCMGGKGKCAKTPKAKYSPPRSPACRKGNASCRDSRHSDATTMGDWCCPGNTDLEKKGYDLENDEIIGPVTCIGRRFQCAEDDEDE